MEHDAAHASFTNGYYDDEGWWALAWIAVYDLTAEQRYLDTAVKIFKDMHAAWNTTPIGGLWWNKDKSYVNAITNELHFSVAAHLANRCSQDEQHYVSVAQDSWNWFYASDVINDRDNIMDGMMAPDPRRFNMPLVWSCKCYPASCDSTDPSYTTKASSSQPSPNSPAPQTARSTQ